MNDSEPSTREFLISLWDALASNRLAKTLRGKFRAQSYFEFFNRLWGAGILLFITGVLTGGIAILNEDSKLSVFDLGNTVILVGAAVVIWTFFVLVGIVNEGETPLYGDNTPNKHAELLKLGAGGVIIVTFSYQFITGNVGFMDFIAISILAAIVTGMWLIALSWFFGGISGLLRLRRESQSSDTAVHDSEGAKRADGTEYEG